MIGAILIRLAASDAAGQLPIAIAVAKGEFFARRQTLLPPHPGRQAHDERDDENRRHCPSDIQLGRHRCGASAQQGRKMVSDSTSRRDPSSSETQNTAASKCLIYIPASGNYDFATLLPP